jgi:uncharacterized protein (TIGR02284 family)
MASDNKQAVATLNRLVKLGIASEKGFNVAAENVKNRGLKVMFKTYAQERAKFVAELRSAVKAMDGEPAEGGGTLAAIHRGWINIKAAMTIGQPATENVVLGEVLRGETVALRTYRDMLERPLPANLRTMVERQMERVEGVHQRALDLDGKAGSQLVLRLFDSEDDLNQAVDVLADAGFDPQRMEKVPLTEVMEVYEGKHIANTTVESALAGAVVGAGLGVLLGLISGVSAVLAPGGSLFGLGLLETFLWTILLGAGVGLFFGALIGSIIGLGVSQEDEYQYASSVQHGSMLLMVRTDRARANEAADLMKRVNARRWRLAT